MMTLEGHTALKPLGAVDAFEGFRDAVIALRNDLPEKGREERAAEARGTDLYGGDNDTRYYYEVPLKENLKERLEKLFGVDGERIPLFTLGEVITIVGEMIEAHEGERPLVDAVIRTRDALITALQDPEASPEVLAAVPHLQLDVELAHSLHLVAASEEGMLDYVASLREMNERVPDAPAVVSRALLESPITVRDNRNESEIAECFLRPRPPAEAAGLRMLLRQLEGRSEELIASFRQVAVAGFYHQTRDFRNLEEDIRTGKANILAFDLMFGFGSVGYGMLYYPVSTFPRLLAFVRTTFQELGTENPFANRILTALDRFEQGPAYERYQKISDGWVVTEAGTHMPRGWRRVLNGRPSTIAHFQRLVVKPFREEMLALRSALQDFEYLLQLGRHYDRTQNHPDAEVVSEPHSPLRIEGGQNIGLVQLQRNQQALHDATLQLRADLEAIRDAIPEASRNKKLRRALYDVPRSSDTEAVADRIDELVAESFEEIPQLTPAYRALMSLGEFRNMTLLEAMEQLEEIEVVLHSDIIGQNIELAQKPGALFVMGPNGCGKSRLVEMILQIICTVHQGIKVQASLVRSPYFDRMGYHPVKPRTRHSRGSTFWRGIAKLQKDLERLDSGTLRKTLGILGIDEFGRGTYELDAVAILMALAEYAQEEGLYLLAPVHLALLYEHRDILAAEGIEIDFKTLDRDSFDVRDFTHDGPFSAGIDEAERVGCEPEVITLSRVIQEAGGSDTIDLSLLDPIEEQREVDTFSALRTQDLVELDFFERQVDIRTGAECFQLGEVLWQYILHSPFRRERYDFREAGNEYAGSIVELPPVLAHTFYEHYTKPMNAGGREERRAVLSAFERTRVPAGIDIDTGEGSLTEHCCSALGEIVHIEDWFCFDLPSPESAMPKRTSATLVEVLNVPGILSRVAKYLEQVDDPPLPLAELTQRLQSLSEHPTWGEIRAFHAEHSLYQLGKDGLESWIKFCHDPDHSVFLREVVQSLGELNFYLMISQGRPSEYCGPTETSPDGRFVLHQALNPSLDTRAEFSRRRRDGKWPYKNPNSSVAEEKTFLPTAVDLQVKEGTMAVGVSGSNGSGKTELIRTAAIKTIDALQTGRCINGSVTIPDNCPFVAYSEINANGDPSKGSWANEVISLQSIIDAYKEAGSPRGGMIFLDEPGKGTSSAEAVPFLLAYVKYFERRGVRVFFTSHMHNIYEYLEHRLQDGDAIPYQAIHTRYFGDDRYIPREGVGESEGVEIAAEAGLFPRIVNRAYYYRDSLRERMAA